MLTLCTVMYFNPFYYCVSALCIIILFSLDFVCSFFHKQYMTMESESGNYQNLGAAVVIEEGRFHTIIIGEGKKSKGLIKVYLLSIFF